MPDPDRAETDAGQMVRVRDPVDRTPRQGEVSSTDRVAVPHFAPFQGLYIAPWAKCFLDAHNYPPVDLAGLHLREDSVDVVKLVHAVVRRHLAFAGEFE